MTDADWTAQLAPDRDEYDRCYGCGQSNDAGLKMRFAVTGDQQIESRYTADETLSGAPGVVHGGVQATLLDEVCGFACHTLDAPGIQGSYVTAEFSLRYRRPVPSQTELRCIGRVVEVDGSNIHVEAWIELPDGTRATVATARWKCLD